MYMTNCKLWSVFKTTWLFFVCRSCVRQFSQSRTERAQSLQSAEGMSSVLSAFRKIKSHKWKPVMTVLNQTAAQRQKVKV